MGIGMIRGRVKPHQSAPFLMLDLPFLLLLPQVTDRIGSLYLMMQRNIGSRSNKIPDLQVEAQLAATPKKTARSVFYAISGNHYFL